MGKQPGTLGQAIREARLALGLTQEQLAERVGDGVAQAEISRLERGRVQLPRRERLERIARALHLDTGELLARSGWAGARESFGTTAAAVSPPSDAAAGNAAPRVTRAATPGSAQEGGPRAPADTSRLMLALQRSRKIHEQTSALLNRANEIHAAQIRRGGPHAAVDRE